RRPTAARRPPGQRSPSGKKENGRSRDVVQSNLARSPSVTHAGPPEGCALVPGRDIIVVGASAGGVEALTALVRGLPAGLPAAVFVVLPVSPPATRVLPHIL